MRPGALLAGAGLTLAALAVVAGTGGSGAPGAPGPGEISAELTDGTALLDPLELAAMIRERRPLRLVDLRDSSAFLRFSLPTARHGTLSELAAWDGEEGGPPIVIHDDGGGEAARAWLVLRRLGHSDVRVLRGGVRGWLDHVINPVLPAGTPSERERFDRVADLSRYFGGTPRVGDPGAGPPPGGSAEAAINLLSRRGCY